MLIRAINQAEAAAMPVPRILIRVIPRGKVAVVGGKRGRVMRTRVIRRGRGAGRRRRSSEPVFLRKGRKAQPGFRF